MSDTESSDVREHARPDRTLALTDAVIAIAMTLLALDLRPTLPPRASSDRLADYLGEHVSKYASFAIAFALIAQYWVVHHRMMRTVRHVTPRLVGETLLFLFMITLVPLSTYLTGTYGNSLAYTIFAGNIFVAAVSLGSMGETIHRHALDDRTETRVERIRRRSRSLTSLAIPVLVGALAWVLGGQAAWLYLLYTVADYPGALATRRLRPG